MKTEIEQILELIGSLKRLVVAAKPHCVPTSTLNMRVIEAEKLLTTLNQKTK